MLPHWQYFTQIATEPFFYKFLNQISTYISFIIDRILLINVPTAFILPYLYKAYTGVLWMAQTATDSSLKFTSMEETPRRERPFRYYQCLQWNPHGIHYGSKGTSYMIFYPTFLVNLGL